MKLLPALMLLILGTALAAPPEAEAQYRTYPRYDGYQHSWDSRYGADRDHHQRHRDYDRYRTHRYPRSYGHDRGFRDYHSYRRFGDGLRHRYYHRGSGRNSLYYSRPGLYIGGDDFGFRLNF